MLNFITGKQINGLSPRASLNNQVGKVFNKFFNNSCGDYFPGRFSLVKDFNPKINISETDKTYVIDIDLFGLRKEEV
jgi:HSP20 family molecular chaperone IbpA